MKRVIIAADSAPLEVSIEKAFDALSAIPAMNRDMFIESISDKSREACDKLKAIHDARSTVRGNLSMYKKQFLLCDNYGVLTYLTLNNDDDLGELDVIRYVNQYPKVGKVKTVQGIMPVRYDNKLNCYLIGGRGDRDFYYLAALPSSDADMLIAKQPE